MTYGAVLQRQETLALRMAREGWIIHPQQGKIRFIARDYQRELWNDKSRFRIVVKARQIGMSQAVGAEAVDKAMKSICKILMISRNADQAIQLLGYCKTVYQNLDHQEVGLVAENMTRMVFANGSEIVSLPANKSAGRGYAASHIYFDEAAHAMYADQIWGAIAPSISTGGTITVLSSPLGPHNLFGRIANGARGPVRDFDGTAAPDGTWSKHFIPWQRNPGYTTEKPGWYDAERGKYTDDQWASEFDASLEGSGEVVFKEEYLNRLIEGWVGTNGMAEIEPIWGDLWYMEPVPGRLYVTAWDLGRKNDPTVGITLDVTDPVHQLVAFERFHKMPWDEQEERVQNRYGMYPGWHVVDATGVGDPVHQALVFAGYDILPFVFSRVTKPYIVDELIRSTEHEMLKLGLAVVYDEMHDYRRKDEYLQQDTVMALGMAEYTARHLDLEETYQDDDRVEDASRAFGGL